MREKGQRAPARRPAGPGGVLGSPRPGQPAPGVGRARRCGAAERGCGAGDACEHTCVGTPLPSVPCRARAGPFLPQRDPLRGPVGFSAARGRRARLPAGAGAPRPWARQFLARLDSTRSSRRKKEARNRLGSLSFIIFRKYHRRVCTAAAASPPSSPCQALLGHRYLRTWSCMEQDESWSVEAVPALPPSRDQETRARETRLPWSPGGEPGWDMPRQWLWHGAHSEATPLLRGRADSRRTPACPREQSCLAHTCWLRGSHPPARLFLTHWSPGKHRLWSAAGFRALSIPRSPLSHPLCRDHPLGQLHVDTVLLEGRWALQGGRDRV